MTQERFEEIKKTGNMMAGNIGPKAFKELIEEIESLNKILIKEDRKTMFDIA